ncbi:MAG: PilW family protein [Steroidobacteraceae bacterium]
MKRHFTGFSLVELMVAITLGLLLTTAVISVFVGSRSAYQSTAGVGALSDGGRFALGLIGESARSAGSLACNSTMSATSDSILPAGLATNFLQGVTGYEANGTGNPVGIIALPAVPVVGGAGAWTPNLDAALTGVVPGSPVQGSDVLVLYSSVARVAPVYTIAAVNIGDTAIRVSPDPSVAPEAMFAGQYAAVSDCTKSVAFQIASVTGGAAGAVNVAGGSITRGFVPGALVAPLTTTVYYIGVGSDGDGALWRLEQVNGPALTAEELVPDVENMQVLYGIDTAGNQTASQYVTADQIGTFNVVSLQVAVLAASPPGSTPAPAAAIQYNLLGNTFTAPRDNRLRKVFFAMINLRDAVN